MAVLVRRVSVSAVRLVGAGVLIAASCAWLPGWPAEAADLAAGKEVESLRLAIADLVDTFGNEYAGGESYRKRLETIRKAIRSGDAAASAALGRLRQEALLANPLLDFDKLLVLKRRRGQLGLPTNHQCNSCLDQQGYDNEIDRKSVV